MGIRYVKGRTPKGYITGNRVKGYTRKSGGKTIHVKSHIRYHTGR